MQPLHMKLAWMRGSLSPLARLKRIYTKPFKKFPMNMGTQVMMITPKYFSVNIDAQPTNSFIVKSSEHDKDTLQTMALTEHQHLVQALRDHHIFVHLFENNIPGAMDAMFCNNWISIHHPPETTDHQLVVYPMLLPNRRIEVRQDIIDYIRNRNSAIGIIDLRLPAEASDRERGRERAAESVIDEVADAYLEGTGSMVIDRKNKVIYAALSPRTYLMALKRFAALIGHKLVFFQTSYKRAPIYHTNVLMAIGGTWVVICKEVIAEGCREYVMTNLKESGKTIIEITKQQLQYFCANIIELRNAQGIPYTVMSQCAHDNFSPEQKSHLGNLIVVPFYTIEKYGGGGVRCCITEM